MIGFGFGRGGRGQSKHGNQTVATVGSLDLSEAPASIEIGGTHQLSVALVANEEGVGEVSRVVVWSSANAAIATVSATGLVTGIGVGTVVITASHGSVLDTATFVVVTPASAVDHVTVSPAAFTLQEGSTRQLSAAAYDASNNLLQGKSFTWDSANDAIVTVDASGVATGVLAGGPVNITATETGESVVGTSAATIAVPTGTNEPVGTELILALDADVLATGRNRPLPWGTNGWWLPTSIPNPDGIAPVQIITDDADFDGSICLQLNFPRTMVASGPQVSWGSWPAAYSILYIRYVFKLHPQWTWHTSAVNKQFYWDADQSLVAGSEYGFVLDASGASDTTGRLKPFKQYAGTGTSTTDYKEANPGSIVKGTKHTVELLMQAQSAPGVADGELRCWVDGTLKALALNNTTNTYETHRTTIKWVPDNAPTTKFKGFNWHAYWGGGASTTPKPQNEWIRVGELYVSGIQ